MAHKYLTDLAEIISEEWKLVLYAIGAYLLVQTLVFPLLISSYKFLAKSMRKDYLRPTNGAWAVVTGASDGIGKDFCLQLSKLGFNIVLVARSTIKLQEVASAITTKTKIITFDFNTTDDRAYTGAFEELKGMDIKCLVNNVGVSHERPINFTDESMDKLNAIINVNVHSAIKMTHLILPGMIKSKSGLILNIVCFSN